MGQHRATEISTLDLRSQHGAYALQCLNRQVAPELEYGQSKSIRTRRPSVTNLPSVTHDIRPYIHDDSSSQPVVSVPPGLGERR